MSEEGESVCVHTEFAGSLQWSLARMSEEGQRATARALGVGGASMEPRSNERGRRVGVRAHRVRLRASMEPRSNERGRHRGGAGPPDRWGASMEPRSNERGRTGTRLKKAKTEIKLQWSLARMSEEGHGSARRSTGAPSASMEPRSNERGRPAPLPERGEHGQASMEPRSNERGRPQTAINLRQRAVELQWSLARMSEEGWRARARSAARGCFNGASLE